MTPRWYGTVVALVAAAAVSGCANGSQVAGTQPPASIAAPTALSRPSDGPVNLVATAPAPPPRTALPASPSAPPETSSAASPTASAQTGPSVAADPTSAAQSGPPGTDTPGPKGQLYTKHAAQLRLAADLAALQLPKGAVRQTSPIPAVINRGSGGIGAVVASTDTWWTVPGQRADVKAFIAKQHPDGMSYQGGGGDNEGEATLDFEYPLGAKAPFTFFEVGIAQDGDHTDVRLQLQVAYLPTRTAIETIPASVTSGTGIYQPPNQILPSNATPAPRRAATLSASDVRVIAEAFNGLDAQPSGIVHSCPPPNGEEAWFTFTYSGHTVVFHAALNGCGGVLVTADGVPQPELSLSDAVFSGVERALHVTKAENPFLTASP